VKLPDNVILDETVSDQMRFHRVISMGINVPAALTWTDGEFPLQTQTITFGSENKPCQMFIVSWIEP
jgi:hypothetical protein